VRVPLAEATLTPVPAGVTDEQARPRRRSGRGTGAARCSPPHQLAEPQHGCGLRPALQLCNYEPVGVRQSSDWQHQAACCDPILKTCYRALFSNPTGPRRVQAVLCGDVLATGWFCAERGRIAEQAGAPGGAAVAVLGLGPVGLMAAVAARQLGAAQARPPPHLRGGTSDSKDARVGRTLPRAVRAGQRSGARAGAGAAQAVQRAAARAGACRAAGPQQCGRARVDCPAPGLRISPARMSSPHRRPPPARSQSAQSLMPRLHVPLRLAQPAGVRR